MTRRAVLSRPPEFAFSSPNRGNYAKATYARVSLDEGIEEVVDLPL
jgi:hypothetical protein